jgi:hypothetical protein
LAGVELAVKAKAATSKKKAFKLADLLVKGLAKVEQQYEHQLLKKTNDLKRQLLDVKLRNVQYEFIKVEQLGYYFEKVVRAQNEKLQQLQAALLPYKIILIHALCVSLKMIFFNRLQGIDLTEVGRAMQKVDEPQFVTEKHELTQVNKNLRTDVRALGRAARREKREVDRHLEQLREAIDAEAELMQNEFDDSTVKENCR